MCADAVVEIYAQEKSSIDFFESRDLDAQSPPPVVRFHKKLQTALRRMFEVIPVYREIVGLLYEVCCRWRKHGRPDVVVATAHGHSTAHHHSTPAQHTVVVGAYQTGCRPLLLGTPINAIPLLLVPCGSLWFLVAVVLRARSHAGRCGAWMPSLGLLEHQSAKEVPYVHRWHAYLWISHLLYFLNTVFFSFFLSFFPHCFFQGEARHRHKEVCRILLCSSWP